MVQDLVYGIDVGTTKIVAIAGRVDARRGSVEVLSMGEAPSRGLRRGVVVDRAATAESVAAAMDACEVQGGEVVVGVSGSHVSSFNAEVTLLNRARDMSITPRFLRKLEEEVRHVELHEDEQLVHLVPRGYVLDGSEGVTRPVGLSARKVTMRAHVATGAVSSIQNLLRAVEDCGVSVSRVVLEPLASAESCLTEEDRNAGVALVDIGGGTTDVAAFSRGVLAHTAVVPVGGENFTSDVAYGLKVPFESAEKLKVRYGTVLPGTVDSVAAVSVGGRHYNAHFMSQVLEYRARECLEYAREALDDARLRRLLPAGTVLTGGGSLLDGMIELSEEVLDTRVKTAVPRLFKGDSKPLQQPQYATSVGLLYFAARTNERVSKSKGATVSSFGSILKAVKEWFGFGVGLDR